MADKDGNAIHYEFEKLAPAHTHIDNAELAALPLEHQEYLLERHGTIDLDPLPDMSDADPYNWPAAKV